MSFSKTFYTDSEIIYDDFHDDPSLKKFVEAWIEENDHLFEDDVKKSRKRTKRMLVFSHCGADLWIFF